MWTIIVGWDDDDRDTQTGMRTTPVPNIAVGELWHRLRAIEAEDR